MRLKKTCVWSDDIKRTTHEVFSTIMHGSFYIVCSTELVVYRR